MTTTKLTDAEIDGLSGNDLRDAVARAMGWTTADIGTPWWYAPGEHMQPFRAWHFPTIDVNDKGRMLDLLLGLDYLQITSAKHGHEIAVCVSDGGQFVSAIGPTADIASLCCKAFLKLENRKAE